MFYFDAIFKSKSTQVYSVFYSHYPGPLNTYVIIVNFYRSMGISKQSLSTNVPVRIHVELIGQLSAYQLQYTSMYR